MTPTPQPRLHSLLCHVRRTSRDFLRGFGGRWGVALALALRWTLGDHSPALAVAGGETPSSLPSPFALGLGLGLVSGLGLGLALARHCQSSAPSGGRRSEAPPAGDEALSAGDEGVMPLAGPPGPAATDDWLRHCAAAGRRLAEGQHARLAELSPYQRRLLLQGHCGERPRYPRSGEPGDFRLPVLGETRGRQPWSLRFRTLEKIPEGKTPVNDAPLRVDLQRLGDDFDQIPPETWGDVKNLDGMVVNAPDPHHAWLFDPSIPLADRLMLGGLALAGLTVAVSRLLALLEHHRLFRGQLQRELVALLERRSPSPADAAARRLLQQSWESSKALLRQGYEDQRRWWTR